MLSVRSFIPVVGDTDVGVTFFAPSSSVETARSNDALAGGMADTRIRISPRGVILMAFVIPFERT